MKYSFQVENIRCGGCTNSITKKLIKLDGVKEVHVIVNNKQVTVTTDSTIHTNMRKTLSEKLAKLGYPELGSEGTNRLMTKATSVVSCALGKVSNKT
ncbi:MAG: heavy-metal-associated domain-containing protein [Gammaproteobacteria bacterium]|nr:heavy-metal-associated domain-containing protein [Gammaproteobacteria bacterium]